jgi:hypothetical protein
LLGRVVGFARHVDSLGERIDRGEVAIGPFKATWRGLRHRVDALHKSPEWFKNRTSR